MAKITDLDQNLVGGNAKTNLVGDTSITVEPLELKAKSVLQILKMFRGYILENAVKGDTGAQGLSIIAVNISLYRDGEDGNTYTMTCTLSDMTTINAGTFFVPKGDKGETGETGNGIASIAKTGTSGLIDSYRITFTDGTYFDYTVTNGADGATGNGISGISKISTVGLVDTYRITFTDGTYFDFDVTNGQTITNYVTTDTEQTISGQKTFTGGLRTKRAADGGGYFYVNPDGNGHNVKIGFSSGGEIMIHNGGIQPNRSILPTGSIDLGSSANKWKDLHLSGNLTDGTNSVAIANIAQKGTSDLVNYYTKLETYTQAEVNALIGNIKTIKAEIVVSLPTADATTYFNDSKTIYMTAIAGGSGTDYYNEYITIRTGSEGSYVYSWEKIGTTQIDLSGYLQKSNDTLKLYGTGSTAGVQMMWTINNDGTVGNAICQRDAYGSVVVPTPTANGQSANKKYVDDGLATKQATLTFDDTPTQNSSNPVKSGGVYSGLAGKQDTISDLATIRAGAESGATAVQPNDLQTAESYIQKVKIIYNDANGLSNGGTLQLTGNASLPNNTKLLRVYAKQTRDNHSAGVVYYVDLETIYGSIYVGTGFLQAYKSDVLYCTMSRVQVSNLLTTLTVNAYSSNTYSGGMPADTSTKVYKIEAIYYTRT